MNPLKLSAALACALTLAGCSINVPGRPVRRGRKDNDLFGVLLRQGTGERQLRGAECPGMQLRADANFNLYRVSQVPVISRRGYCATSPIGLGGATPL